MTFSAALEQCGQWDYAGIGLMLGEVDDETSLIALLERQACRADGEQWDPAAADHIQSLRSYTETSANGTDISVLCFGKLPGAGRNLGNHSLVDRGFLAITGQLIEGSPLDVERRDEELTALYARLLPAEVEDRQDAPIEPRACDEICQPDGTTAATIEETVAPTAELEQDENPATPPATLSDEQVIEMMANDTIAGKYWHLSQDSNGPRADFAVISRLLVYCGGDQQQAERLFLRNELATRSAESRPIAAVTGSAGVAVPSSTSRRISRDSRPSLTLTTSILQLRSSGLRSLEIA
jgi:hypothetical protein